MIRREHAASGAHGAGQLTHGAQKVQRTEVTAGSREDMGERDRCVCVGGGGVTSGEITEGGRACEMRESWIFPPSAVGHPWKAFSKGEMSRSS